MTRLCKSILYIVAIFIVVSGILMLPASLVNIRNYYQNMRRYGSYSEIKEIIKVIGYLVLSFSKAFFDIMKGLFIIYIIKKNKYIMDKIRNLI